MTWFLLDIAFYSQNLFLPDLLRTTGFSSFPDIPTGGVAACTGACAEAVWNGIFRSALGNAIVALIGKRVGGGVDVRVGEREGEERRSSGH